MQKLDILAFGAHPDDVELGCGGSLLAAVAEGKKIGIIDLTKGELGTRGTVADRSKEAELAGEIIGATIRENLGMQDGFFVNDQVSQLKLIEVIRAYKPDIVLANALEDRHPDHGKGAQLAIDACFLSGLRKIETSQNGEKQTEWRPKQVFHYIQDRYLEPDFVIDITEHWSMKEAAIRAFRSQFFDPNSNEPASYISSPEFLHFIEARAREMGHKIGVTYGEGFQTQKTIAIQDLSILA